MTRFAVTWDYRCPFARNAHEHVLAGLAAGAAWDVAFVPFSLGQVHVEEGDAPIWDRPGDDSGLVALQVGVHVRDTAPDAFPAVHGALFSARHDQGRDLRDRDVLAKVLADAGLDPEAALAAVDDGSLLAAVRAEHEAAAAEHSVWGVPTFVAGGQAAFVRLMDRPGDDGAHARRTIDRVVDLLVDAPALNEFKHTSISH
ncbi:MAG TPA: DsbA family protein [Acidimicrobiales bacterium]|nr:DsbA family protein [Acidimicrobiales bacterium]